jgi:thiol-disulfide isomerase/thioredoxin
MRLFSLCAIAVLLLAGCEGGVPATSESDVPAPDSVPNNRTTLSPEDVNLVEGDEKKLDAMIAAHKGKVVFVDYWATWCHPCVEYFPHTVEMHHKYKDQGLAVIAVSFDDPEEEGKARKYLADQGADFENLLSNLGQGPAAFEGFQIDNVPHFRLYDRTGKLVHKWDDQPTDADEKIEELLAQKETPAAE